MQNLDELELAALGARPVRKPRPWGWFLAALLLIGGVSFVLSFYLPLKTSFQTLLGEHEALAKKARELDDALVSAKTSLDSTEVKRASLQKSADEVASALRAKSDKLSAVSAQIEKQIGKQLESGKISLKSEPSELIVSLEAATALAPTGKVLPAALKPLCAVAGSAAKDNSMRVTAVVPVSGDKGDVWGNAGKAAAGVAEAIGRCKLPSDRLSVLLSPSSDDSPKLRLSVKSVDGE